MSMKTLKSQSLLQSSYIVYLYIFHYKDPQSQQIIPVSIYWSEDHTRKGPFSHITRKLERLSIDDNTVQNQQRILSQTRKYLEEHDLLNSPDVTSVSYIL